MIWMYILSGAVVILAVLTFVLYRKLILLKKVNGQFIDALNTIGLPVVLSGEQDKCFYINQSARQWLQGSEKESFSNARGLLEKTGLSVVASKNEASKVGSIICLDKTELENQKILHKKEVHWLTSILDAITSPISVTNKDMEWTFINKVTEQMLGVKRKDIVGKKCSSWGANICNTEDCGIACLQKGKNETNFSQFGGTFNVFSTYLYDENEEVIGHVEVVRDITELSNKKSEFEEKAHWYESILDAIPFPISVTDSDLKWTFVNKATENVLGKKRASLVSLPCSSWGATICNTPNCGINCAKNGTFQTTFSQGDMTFSVDVAILKDSRGKDIGFIEVVQDVTKLNSTISKLKDLMNQLSNISEQVADGVRQVTDSSQILAEGALSQTESINELNKRVELITSQTNTNATNASMASDLSDKSKQNAIRGNQEMEAMLSSMNGIKESSNNISKIIKTIEDIAFQTNLLALNAAVEAARAGAHGKGFAVVAEEVRTLAGRSQIAAGETNDLILDSIHRVDDGTKIAQSTAAFLNTIVSDFDKVSQIISEIDQASKEQAVSIKEIGVDIAEISNVVQTNSATSQEIAASSEELSAQADNLRNMLIEF